MGKTTLTIDKYIVAMMDCVADPERAGFDGICLTKGKVRASNGHLLVDRPVAYDGPEVRFRIETDTGDFEEDETAEVDFTGWGDWPSNIEPADAPWRAFPSSADHNVIVTVVGKADEFPLVGSIYAQALGNSFRFALNPDLLTDIFNVLGGKRGVALGINPEDPHAPIRITPLHDDFGLGHAMLAPIAEKK